MVLKELFKGFADLVYPRLCAVCKSKLDDSLGEEHICLRCRNSIKMNAPPFCRRCGRQLRKPDACKNSICPSCIRKTLHFDRAYSPCLYEGVIKELIQQFKYKDRRDLGKLLAEIITAFIREFEAPVEYTDFIVPVPLHSAKMREREYNQAQILAQHLSIEFKKPLLCGSLVRWRSTKTQTDLQDKDREKNVLGAFRVKEPSLIKGKSVLLVDDVLTTGATSSQASLALKDCGATAVFVITAAD